MIRYVYILHNILFNNAKPFYDTPRQTVTFILIDLEKSNQCHFKRKSIVILDTASLSYS